MCINPSKNYYELIGLCGRFHGGAWKLEMKWALRSAQHLIKLAHFHKFHFQPATLPLHIPIITLIDLLFYCPTFQDKVFSGTVVYLHSQSQTVK